MEIDLQTLKKWAKGKDDFFQTCYRRFGSMNKNDYEVALFHLMLENEYADKSDYYMSKMLQIPESKIRRLRYEANLVYPKNDDEFKNKFYELLNCQSYKITNDNKIQFAVHDKMLRLYLNDKLDEVGSFSDSSFNSSIVTISASDLIILLSKFENREEALNHIKEEIAKNGMLLPKNISEYAKDAFVAVAKDLGSRISEHVTNFIIDSIINKSVNIK